MRNKEANRIGMFYLILGTIWILFTDRLLLFLGLDKEALSQWGTVKGLVYVFLTSGLLFVFVRKHLKSLITELHKREQAEEGLRRVLGDSDIYRQQFQSLFDHNLLAVFSLDLHGTILNVNTACLHLLGYGSKEILGTDIAQLLHPLDEGGHSFIRRLKPFQNESDGNLQSLEVLFLCKGGNTIPLRVLLVPTLVEEKLYSVYVVAEDVTERKKAQHILNQQSRILETIVEGSSLLNILESIVAIIEKDHSDRICSILTLDEPTQKLYTIVGPSLPEVFNVAINGVSIGPNVGSCGTAAFTRQTIIVEDIASDPLWDDFRHLALPHNLRACWSTPIFSRNGKVLGTFAMYSKQSIKPNSYELDALNTYTRLVGMAIERDHSEEIVKLTESRYQLIAENSKDLIAMINIKGDLDYISPSIYKIMGYKSEPTNKDLMALVHQEDLFQLRESFYRITGSGEAVALEIRGTDIHNGLIWFEVRGDPIYNSHGDIEHALFVARDITERKKHEESLEKLAYYDTLTGLPNRRMMTKKVVEMIGNAVRKPNSFALLCMDCDRFKNLNDSLGYESGDRFLQMMSERLLSCAGEHDIVARYGGDGFMILLTEINSEQDARHAAENILNELRNRWEIDGDPFYLTSSIGIALYTDQESASSMVQHAEIAVYQSKRSGKNTISVYKQASNDVVSYNPFLLEKQLYGALERNEFELWYQAQINFQTGEMIGVEALIRWNHPHWGLIVPSEFILLTEDTGLVVPIGEWVLRTACCQSKLWERTGLPDMHISVNISPRQLNDPEFVDMVFGVLEETGLDPNRLYLEITEGMLLDNDPRTYEILKKLHDRGIHLSVDDFGTGYSSLSYIKRYPIDLIKIDRSFIQDIPEDANDIAIIKAIIDLSGSLGIEVLAEGTEELKQIQCLHELGCHVVQGYFFSKPLSSEGFIASYEEILRKSRTVHFIH